MGKNAEWLRNYIDKNTWFAITIIGIVGFILIIIVIFLISVYRSSETPGEGIENIAKALELFCIPGCAILLWQTNIILKSIDSKIGK